MDPYFGICWPQNQSISTLLYVPIESYPGQSEQIEDLNFLKCYTTQLKGQ